MRVHTLPWFYLGQLASTGAIVQLTGEEWHHCMHVLRLGVGDGLVLFDGKGHGFEGVILKTGKQEGHIELISDISEYFPSAQFPRINIAFAPTKNIDRTEFAVEKIVEIGVHSITFLDCQYGERATLRMDRIKKIALAAAKQSRKLAIPDIYDLIPYATFIHQSQIQNPDAIVLGCHLSDDTLPLFDTYAGEENVVVLIGPEGGFSDMEVEVLKSHGGHLTSLGLHRLRVETAVITACANIHQLYALKHRS